MKIHFIPPWQPFKQWLWGNVPSGMSNNSWDQHLFCVVNTLIKRKKTFLPGRINGWFVEDTCKQELKAAPKQVFCQKQATFVLRQEEKKKKFCHFYCLYPSLDLCASTNNESCDPGSSRWELTPREIHVKRYSEYICATCHDLVHFHCFQWDLWVFNRVIISLQPLFTLSSKWSELSRTKSFCVYDLLCFQRLRWLLSSVRWVSATNITQALWREDSFSARFCSILWPRPRSHACSSNSNCAVNIPFFVGRGA